MANVRAGVAYVDVRLGAIDNLKRDMQREIENIGRDAGKKLGDSVSKSVPASTGSVIGKNLNKELTKAFFQDAKNDFGAGFRALSTGQLSTARALFSSAGRDLSTAVGQGFRNGISRFNTGLDGLAAKVSAFSSNVGNAAQRGWSKFQEFGKSLDSASQRMGFLSFQIANFGIIASAAFTAPTVAALGFASAIGIKTAAEIESATNALKYLLPAGYDVESLLKRLQKIAIESPIFDTTDLIQYAQVFTAAGVEINKTERFLRAFSNIALVTGTTTEKANLAVRAITQAFGKGKLQAEELNQQLGEAMPSVLKLLREELGVTQQELTAMVKEGKITGDDLIRVFTNIGESEKFLRGAAAGAETLNGVWQNFKETLQTQLGLFFLENAQDIKDAIKDLGPTLQQLIQLAGPAFLKLIDGFQSLVDWITKVVNWYKSLSPGTQDIVNKVLLFGTILGPVVLALGAFAGAIAGIAAGIAAIATPVGGIVVAIVAIVAAIVAGVMWFKNWLQGGSEAAEGLKKAFMTFYQDNVVPVIDSLKKLWESVKEAFNQIKTAIMGNTGSWKSWGGFLKELWTGIWALLKGLVVLIIGVIKTVIDVLGPVIKAIASLISGIIKIFKGLTDFLIGVFTGDWSRAWEGIKQIWDGIWDAIIGTLVNLVKAIVNLVKGLVTSIINFFKTLYNVLVGNSIVPDMVNAIIKWFRRLVDLGRSVLTGLGNFISGFYGRWIKPFVDRIAAGVNLVVSKFNDLKNRAINAITGLGSRMYGIGQDVIRGLINGIQNMAGRLYDVAAGIASSVTNKIKSVFDIGSPSRVFYQIGEWNVEGLMNGMRDMIPAANRVANSLGSIIPTTNYPTGSPREPFFDQGSASAALHIENYYANDNVDPWRQAEDWHFLVSARGGVS
jgi:tape measure domain-containing protein